jgi:antitoxin (DNA-binding transcriptional repressor) of toxin-antitoxin stability system
MYIVKRYTVSQVRERLSDALDEAEKGIPVVIERKGVRYRLAVETPSRSPRKPRFRIEIRHPAIEAGQWTWDWTPGGLKFRDTRRK